ncbi:MAG: hypothetical protein KEFWMYNX_000176, partial [Candidatus Fervidibacter sp.]
MAQVFAISISGSENRLPIAWCFLNLHRWTVKAMRLKRQMDDEKVVYLSCPCAK